MTAAVSAPHSLAVTLVETVLQRANWPAPQDLGAGYLAMTGRCLTAMADVAAVRRVARQAAVDIKATAARPASDQPYFSGYVT